ncbi:hypothetical protein [Pyrobaculum neutrophilum]|uniref:Uncharacterized protein n=1 Tax=Pyrobaculum neutrophilum (strain DSM 2338 / JCM 9278 / NBRC 100436 / V24Sta) TaxID=444157 RepID=B1YDV9_PYRNV|nr:hypothetical protein [Pyrobaculum neutrophilum]ACB39972.1 conserved hypothetical protein [Pyrobaculum neutrophilum V24Sta]
MDLPEIGELELENPDLSAAGPAEYTVNFGRPCRVAANVRLDALSFTWPRIRAKALAAVYKCGDLWPHLDVEMKATTYGKTIVILVDTVARHAEPDAEVAPLERGLLWNYAAKVGAAALCKTLKEILHIDTSCKTYTRLE